MELQPAAVSPTSQSQSTLDVMGEEGQGQGEGVLSSLTESFKSAVSEIDTQSASADTNKTTAHDTSEDEMIHKNRDEDHISSSSFSEDIGNRSSSRRRMRKRQEDETLVGRDSPEPARGRSSINREVAQSAAALPLVQ